MLHVVVALVPVWLFGKILLFYKLCYRISNSKNITVATVATVYGGVRGTNLATKIIGVRIFTVFLAAFSTI